MQRHVFPVVTDTGTFELRSAPVDGEIAQVRWHHTGGDTGGAIALDLMVDAIDTGPAFPVLACGLLAPGWLKAPRQPTHDVGGNVDLNGDTGTPVSPEPFVANREALRLRVTPSGGALQGRLYVWVRGC
jgi:hypothetical protein